MVFVIAIGVTEEAVVVALGSGELQPENNSAINTEKRNKPLRVIEASNLGEELAEYISRILALQKRVSQARSKILDDTNLHVTVGTRPPQLCEIKPKQRTGQKRRNDAKPDAGIHGPSPIQRRPSASNSLIWKQNHL